MNTGAILARINFGLAFGAAHAGTFDQLASAPRTDQVDAVVAAILNGDASPDTRHILLSGNNPLVSRASDSGLGEIIGLALGAPEFQRH